MELSLPYPPSINHYWRRVGAKTLISKQGRLYREAVKVMLFGCRPLDMRLAVEIDLHPPDRRRRDIDNAIKATLDALQHGGAFLDDSQIDRLLVERRECCAGGKCVVRVMAKEWA